MSAAGADAGAQRWALALASAAIALTALDITVVNVALGSIAGDLSAQLGGLQWIVNAYTLSFAALLLTGGALADRYGPRDVFVAGVLLFTAASIACGAAPGIAGLELARAVQGAGAALAFPAALALIATHYEQERARQTAIGVFNAVAGAAASLGPLVGGAVIETGGSWRWIFLLNVPIGLAAAAAALLVLERRAPARARGRRPDLLGAVLAIGALFCLNYAFVSAPVEGWGSTPVLASLALAAALAAAFVAAEALGAAPMLDLALFRVPAFSGAVALSLVVRVASFGAFPFITIWLQGVLGLSALETGVRLLAMTLVVLAVAPLTGRLQERFGPFAVIAAGFATAGAGFASMATVDATSTWTAILPGLVLLGLGIALAYPPLMGVAVRVVPPARVGIASGTVNTFFPLGTAVGVAVFGAMFAGHIGAALPDGTLAAAGLPAGAGDALREAVAAGRLEQLAALAPAHAGALLALTQQAFTAALAEVMLAAAGVCALGAAGGAALARATRRDAPRAGARELDEEGARVAARELTWGRRR